eukprot:CAMPEP_0178992946 /NCGR_PEP_ID=MMETSP0795-20121207/6412_1 /TAXON_ID=88552 /ORGANISM="Amoebophrya sp., Strain Ameob2" /LENGTH=544 /DNA_ID=CAMNT_0020684915 /DNA_START=34 /DNA_END=1668 /DNA_ORIENTATION=+
MFALYFFRLFALLLELASGNHVEESGSSCLKAEHEDNKILKPLHAATDEYVIIEQNHQISNHASDQICLKRCAAYASCHALNIIRVTTTMKYCIMIAGPVTTAATWTATTTTATTTTGNGHSTTELQTRSNWQLASKVSDLVKLQDPNSAVAYSFIMYPDCRTETLGAVDTSWTKASCDALQIEDVQLSGASVTAPSENTYNECLGRCAHESGCVAFVHASSPTGISGITDGQPTCWLKKEVTAEEERDTKQGFVSLYMSSGCRGYANLNIGRPKCEHVPQKERKAWQDSSDNWLHTGDRLIVKHQGVANYENCLLACARHVECSYFTWAKENKIHRRLGWWQSATNFVGDVVTGGDFNANDCWLIRWASAKSHEQPKDHEENAMVSGGRMTENCRTHVMNSGLGAAGGGLATVQLQGMSTSSSGSSPQTITPTDHDDEDDDYILVVVVGLCCVAAVVGGAVLVRSHIKTKETLMLRRQRLRNIVPHGAGSRLQQGAYVLPLGRPITPASYAARREHFAQRRKGKGKGKGAGKGKHGRPPPLYY